MVEVRVKRNAVVISDKGALNGGVVVVPRGTFAEGRLDVVVADERAAVVWRRGVGVPCDVVLLAYDAVSEETAREAVTRLADLLADKVLRVGDGGGPGGWKVAALTSWMVIAALGGVLGGAAAMGGEESWSKLGAMAAAKVWPSTCPTPEMVNGAVATAVRSDSAVSTVPGGMVMPQRGAGPVVAPPAPATVAGADEMRKRMQDAERAVQAQLEKLSQVQAEQAAGGGGEVNDGAGAAGQGSGPRVKQNVFVPLAE